jgi:L-ascorbate metabolism protein UlaG (beta-lactamase superfamily)
MPGRYQISSFLQAKLKEANLTAEEVIGKALNIKAEGFTAEGVMFPEGTAFLAWYKDEPHVARVKGGTIEIAGKKVTSVSAAAAEVTGRPTTNGWAFWLVKLPGKNEFTPIAQFRKAA